MGRFSRFRHIERARSGEAAPEANPAPGGSKYDRFARVRGPAREPLPDAPTPGPVRTFEKRRPTPEAPSTGSSPSQSPPSASAAGPPNRATRICASCGGENGTALRRCFHCEAPLDERPSPTSPSEDPTAANVSSKPLARADAETQRIVGEFLAASVAERTAAQLEPGTWGRRSRRPLGMRLLDRIESGPRRLLLLAVLFGVPLALIVFGERGSPARVFGIVLLAFMASLFLRGRRGFEFFVD